MMLNAEQISATARQWAATFYGTSMSGEHAGDGPYRLVVVCNTALGPYKARKALEFFPGVPIPNLCLRTGGVDTGELALHVVPQLVHDEIDQVQMWRPGARYGLIERLRPAPFAAPPGEDDMAAVFVAAMSAHGQISGSAGIGAVVAQACDRLGWRTVAALINAMDKQTRDRTEDVIAVLEALRSQPGATR